MTNEKKIDLGLRVLVEGFNRRFQDIFLVELQIRYQNIPFQTILEYMDMVVMMMLLVGLVVLMSLMGGKLVGKIQSHKLSDAAKTKSSSISSQENQAQQTPGVEGSLSKDLNLMEFWVLGQIDKGDDDASDLWLDPPVSLFRVEQPPSNGKASHAVQYGAISPLCYNN